MRNGKVTVYTMVWRGRYGSGTWQDHSDTTSIANKETALGRLYDDHDYDEMEIMSMEATGDCDCTFTD